MMFHDDDAVPDIDGKSEAQIRKAAVELRKRLDQPANAAPRVFGFTDVAAFAGQPEHEDVRAEDLRDVDGSERAVDGILAVFWVVAGVGAIDRHRAEPEPRRDHFRGEALTVEPLPEFRRLLANLRLGFAVDIGDGVIVVEHHRREAVLFELGELPVKALRRARGRTVGIGAFAEVPGTETKPVRLRLGHKCARRLGVLTGVGNGKILQKI